ncbi:MAG TPA: cupin domain-containing protein [Smithella sp.]|jgi:quercetin dioxygenase-like cupin family protein|nr:cupin domain-containing protein [Smithella sp.]HPL67452.1 cupin domain-containing protein [Smithellaceae bacterium]
MPFVQLSNITERDMMPGFSGRFVHTKFMTFSFWNTKAGYSLPEHCHPHEQVTTIIRGTFEISVDGETKTVEPGSVVVIPPHAKHWGTSITDCYILDVFYPIREDYL